MKKLIIALAICLSGCVGLPINDNNSVCGNNELDPGEVCDGTVFHKKNYQCSEGEVEKIECNTACNRVWLTCCEGITCKQELVK